MKKHESIQYPAAVENKRVIEKLTLEIKASPDKIFPLACPVEELRWIENWDYQLVYTASGVNETNCIFNEEMSGPAIFGKPMTITWVTTLHDPDKHWIHFLLILEDKAIIQFEINFRETGIDTSTVTWKFVFTALDDEANALENENVAQSLQAILSFLSESLKHYCETDEMLTR